ncbi:hypothetical protein AMK26_07815 [Streptomyces sp. CB03234]|uniref:hypothetical protein n=1 Tax=Streptomyces sp. (strain CB03234) TaxID=1703937 RepID=UPI000939936E|nr:hypothetical protein [Streptomyces sp. CB03234]OKK05991.1 hypothetical protein AMK26_07815 [Streptomyces sp. CB03234]
MPTSKQQDVSMRDLLASCAAASAVSTPPRTDADPEDAATADDAWDVTDVTDAPEPREAAPERRRAA